MRRLLVFVARLHPTLAVVFLVVVAPPAGSTTVIANGLAPPNPANVIDAGNSYPSDTVWVQNTGCDVTVQYPCASPGSPTFVELVTGGVVAGYLATGETSSVTMTGGSVGSPGGGGLSAHDSSTLTMNGGWTRELQAFQHSTATLNDGTVQNYIYAGDAARITMTSGSVRSVIARDASMFTMEGGTMGDGIEATETASVRITGGSHINGSSDAWNSAWISISGEAVMVGISAHHTSTVVMSGGSVDSITAGSGSAVILSGGSVNGISASSSIPFTIYGWDFALDGVPVGLGLLTGINGTLTGKLGTGEMLMASVGSGPFNSILLIPEPGTALLVMTGVLGMAARQRRRANLSNPAPA